MSNEKSVAELREAGDWEALRKRGYDVDDIQVRTTLAGKHQEKLVKYRGKEMTREEFAKIQAEEKLYGYLESLNVMDAGFQTRTGALIVALHGSNPLDRSRSRITKLKSDIAKLEKAIEQTLHPVIKDQDQKQDRAVVEAALAGKPAPEHVFTRDEQKEEAQRRRSALKAEKKKLETELNEIIGSALAELADAAKELAERVDAGDRAELEKYGLPYETSKTVWAIRAFAHRLSGRTATCQTAYYCRAFAEELLQK